MRFAGMNVLETSKKSAEHAERDAHDVPQGLGALALLGGQPQARERGDEEPTERGRIVVVADLPRSWARRIRSMKPRSISWLLSASRRSASGPASAPATAA
ncbi:hypothetical protein [Nannocystis pusilla]|uniref:hypothetical protein n=1 Tax=Nannocystis pusilla TaxID=889268 RepID=UPI003B7EF946